MSKEHSPASDRRLGNAERDLVALGIAVTAILLFVATGGTVMPQVVRSWLGQAAAPDVLLTNAVLLNIALLLFGWRRYSELQREVRIRRRAEALARELAEIDPLTGCLNRRSGLPALESLARQARGQAQELAVLLVDLDNFKQINDIYGHQTGDAVLLEITRRLRSALPPGSVLVRLGGDEFACGLLFREQQEVDRIASSLIAMSATPVVEHPTRLEATLSLGIAATGDTLLADELAGKADRLVHQADIAMYQAKRRGRNRYCWFEGRMEDELRQRNEMESALRLGVSAGEFVPYYEQQIDLETGRLVGFEMLARWHSSRFGLVLPDVFIPIAEEIELIAELSEQVIRKALRDAREWDPSLTLSVNISPLQLRDPWFAQRLLALLVETGFPPQRLELEITESSLHENLGAVRTIFASLKNQGVRLVLDDFGTGYSNLARLRALPFDRIKIDRSFVAELSSEGSEAELVSAIISIGKGLCVPVAAEGIESVEVLRTLRSMGEFKGQGYLYGRPEDADATRERLTHLGLLVPARELEHAAPAAGEAALRQSA